jgi:hypothetical protein
MCAQDNHDSENRSIRSLIDPINADRVNGLSDFIWIELGLNLDEAYGRGNDVLEGFWGFGNYGCRGSQTRRPFPLADARLGLLTPEGAFNKLIFAEPQINLRQICSMMKGGNILDSIAIGIEFGSEFDQVKILEALGISSDDITNDTVAWSLIFPLAAFDKALNGLYDFPRLCIKSGCDRLRLIKCCTCICSDESLNPIVELILDLRVSIPDELCRTDQDAANSKDLPYFGFGGRHTILQSVNKVVGGHHRSLWCGQNNQASAAVNQQ